MMKKLLFLLSIASVQTLCAQPLLSTATPQITFGTTLETATDSIQVTINNSGITDVLISEFKFFSDTYGSQPFSTNPSSLNVPAGSNARVWVRFKPTQNLPHNSELIAVNNSGRGALKIDLLGQGRYSNTYYSTTENLMGEALRVALTTRTGQGFVPLTYAGARDQLFMSIDNQQVGGQNSVTCVYTGRVITGWLDRTAAQNLNFNTEHTFPQSMFNNGAEPMRSDIHHLFTVDETANSVRSNSPFIALTSWTWTSTQIPGYTLPLSKNGPGGFEPRDDHKGKGARGMLYFGMRYNGNAQVSTSFLPSQEPLLMAWSKQFLPTAQEKLRNNRIFNTQGNRNPFIDYPQLLERLKSVTTNADLTPVSIANKGENQVQFNTVAVGSSAIYDYYVVNTGNANLPLSAMIISGAGASSYQIVSTANQIIAAGEAGKIQIKCQPTSTQPAVATLNYNAGNNAQQVPLLANGAVNTQDFVNKFRLSVAPNPVENMANIKLPFDTQSLPVVHAYNALGQEVNIGYQAFGSDQIHLNTAYLPHGMYKITIFFEAENAQCTATFIK